MSDASALRSLLEKVAATPTVATPQPGDVIGRYELVERIGEGGFGTVYEARDRELGRSVAFKWFHASDDERREWHVREVTAIAKLSHPNIVTLLDRGEHQGSAFMVLQLLPGESLAELLHAGRLPVERATTIALGVSRALAHAHRSGVVHLDLKPSNVMIGEDDHATVLDFGLARFMAGTSVSTTLHSTASALRGAGTPAFMAPEQESGVADARTDVFAIGILFYAMLVGELPFALDAASVERVLRPSPAALRAVRAPDAVIAVIEKALAERPEDRYRDAGELAAALGRVRAPRRSSRWPLALAMASTVGVATAWAITSRTDHGGISGTWTVDVPAIATWVDTGIDVQQGQTIVVHATGLVCTKGAELCAGPEGQNRVAEEPVWAMPGFEKEQVGILIGRIDQHPFVIGKHRRERAGGNGRLFLGLNDRDGSNNTGSGFRVTIELR